MKCLRMLSILRYAASDDNVHMHVMKRWRFNQLSWGIVHQMQAGCCIHEPLRMMQSPSGCDIHDGRLLQAAAGQTLIVKESGCKGNAAKVHYLTSMNSSINAGAWPLQL